MVHIRKKKTTQNKRDTYKKKNECSRAIDNAEGRMVLIRIHIPK